MLYVIVVKIILFPPILAKKNFPIFEIL